MPKTPAKEAPLINELSQEITDYVLANSHEISGTLTRQIPLSSPHFGKASISVHVRNGGKILHVDAKRRAGTGYETMQQVNWPVVTGDTRNFHLFGGLCRVDTYSDGKLVEYVDTIQGGRDFKAAIPVYAALLQEVHQELMGK